MPFYMMIIRVKYAVDDAYGVAPITSETSSGSILRRRQQKDSADDALMLAFLRKTLPNGMTRFVASLMKLFVVVWHV